MRWLSLTCSVLIGGWLLLNSVPTAAQDGEPEEDPYAPIFHHDGHEEHHADHHGEGTSDATAVSETASTPAAPHEELSRWTLFVKSYDFWKKPVFVACIAALVLGVVGIYVVLRRVVFATACLANVSGVGVALGALLGLDPHMGEHALVEHPWYHDILGLFGFSLLVTVAAAVTFAWWRESKRISRESMLGVAYVTTAGLLVVLASQVHRATHEIDHIVFGSAVVVEHSQLVIVPIFAAIIIVVHLIFRKDFLFTSFDSATAQAVGYPVRRLDILLFVTIGLAIAITTRAIGALPVFSFVVLPPLTALLLTERLGLAFLLAPLLGAITAAVGYAVAFMLLLPVGPSMTLCCALLFLLAGARGLFRSAS